MSSYVVGWCCSLLLLGEGAAEVARHSAHRPHRAGVVHVRRPHDAERGDRLVAARSLFGSLAEAIVYQQLSNKAAATIYGRVEALYPDAPELAQGLLVCTSELTTDADIEALAQALEGVLA